MNKLEQEFKNLTFEEFCHMQLLIARFTDLLEIKDKIVELLESFDL